MGNVSLYVETDGGSSAPETAIASAALKSPELPFEEGATVMVKIEASWTDPDGNHHAKVSIEEPVKVEDLDDNPHNPLSGVEEFDDDDPALENSPKLEHARDEMEENFDQAADPAESSDPENTNKPQPEKGFYSEGLRQPHLDGAKKNDVKPNPEE